MALKHFNPKQPRTDRNRKKHWARATYNFVPLPEKVITVDDPKAQDKYHHGTLTGWIDCALETCSTTYIRGMLTEKQFEEQGRIKPDKLTVAQKEQRAPFFSTGENFDGQPRPIIPGSSLRGMIRAIVEIAGYGRMRWVADKPTFTFRAVAAQKDDPLRDPYRRVIGDFGRNVRAGYLERENEKWYVRPAKTARDMRWPIDDAFYLKVRESHIQGKDIPNFIRLNSPDYRPQLHKVSFGVEFREGKRGRYAAISQIGSRDAKYQYEGVLVCSGNMLESARTEKESRRKNHTLVLEPNQQAKPLPITEQAEKDYRAGLTPFQRDDLKGFSSFEVNEQALHSLKTAGIPLAILRKLEEMRNIIFIGIEKFENALKATLGEEQKSAYKSMLRKHCEKFLNGWTGDDWGCLKEGVPVFYVVEDNEVVYFGHSPNFRIPAQFDSEKIKKRASTPLDFVPQEIREGNEPDLADAIFGWVKEENVLKNQRERAGRVFFTDAVFEGAKDGVWMSMITPQTLAGPKSTTFQHYLVQDAEAGHDPDIKSLLAHYGTPPDETQIRGHKFYWHKGIAPNIEATLKEQQHESQLTRIMPIKAGVKFSFKIYFENLEKKELGALLWALTLPGESGHTYRHKLGMGKPLGMGAVAITPTLYLTDNRIARYQKLFQNNAWHEEVKQKEMREYLEAFESFVLHQIVPNGQAKRLSDVLRIKILLLLLQWRDGDPKWLDQTRYMEIEHGYEKENEYKERPVLPDAVGVIQQYETVPEIKLPEAKPLDKTEAKYYTGTVIEWRDSYGFIARDDGGKDVFVHKSRLPRGIRALNKEQRLKFKIGISMKGKDEAQDVQLV